MPIINTRQAFKEFCLRKLGDPVIMINVDDDQVEDRIDDALFMWFEYHMNALTKEYLVVELTADHILNKKITVPDTVMSVVRVFPMGGTGTGSASTAMNFSYTAAMSDIIDGMRRASSASGSGLFRYTLVQSQLSAIQFYFSSEKQTRFNRYQHFVQIETDWSELTEGDFVLMEVWQQLDTDTYDMAWTDFWLQMYATQCIKQQWGSNLTKYQSVQLPSGITLNGEQIYSDASQEMLRLEDELRNTWQYPVDFFMG